MQERSDWQWVHHNRHPVYEYLLEDQGRILQKMTFDFRQNVYTAHCESHEDTFHILRTGVFKSRILLQQGNRIIGRLYAKKWWSSSGIIEIEHEQMEYQYSNNPLAEIRVLHKQYPLLVCGIKPAKQRLAISISTASHFDKHPFAGYLLALGFYLLLPGLSEEAGW